MNKFIIILIFTFLFFLQENPTYACFDAAIKSLETKNVVIINNYRISESDEKEKILYKSLRKFVNQLSPSDLNAGEIIKVEINFDPKKNSFVFSAKKEKNIKSSSIYV